jgi:two-component system LytT family sensor kinase
MATDDVRTESPQWLWIASAWLGFGLFDATQTVAVMRSEGMQHDWPRLFAATALSWLPWALATPLVLQLGRRFPLGRRGPYLAWLVHIAAGAAVGLTFSAWTTLLQIVLAPYGNPAASRGFASQWFDTFYNGLLSTLVLYAGILTIRYALDFRERLALQRAEMSRLNEQLAQAKLDALRRQIEPHFLFNTLNAVAGLVREGRSDSAVRTIAVLGEFLRRTLDDSVRQEVPLSEELEFVEKYLDIQKVRFADRLQLSVDVPSDLRGVPVPNLILQPVVENAVNHGIAKLATGGAIRIVASRSGQTLVLSVCNDGPSLAAGWDIARCGVGISNVRTRLQSLYGSAFALRMHNRTSGGVEAVVSIPLRDSLALE